IVPETVEKLSELGLDIVIEKDAGLGSNYLDKNYEEAGASVTEDRDSLFSSADILITIQSPPQEDLNKLQEGSVLICFLWALQNEELVAQLKLGGITALGMDA